MYRVVSTVLLLWNILSLLADLGSESIDKLSTCVGRQIFVSNFFFIMECL